MSSIINKTEKILLSDGIFLIIIGMLMIYLSQATTVIFAFILSIGMFFLGLYKIINSIISRNEISTVFISVIGGLLLSIIGGYLIFHPIFNTLVLTIGTAIYFLVESINSISFAISSKGFKQIFWIGLFAGVSQLLLAIMIILGLPDIAIWLIGMLLGINFILSGITEISLYSYLKAPNN